ncbi:MAG TPA: pseudaminic acid cytidylyltransferase [Planctomycetota bacterium]|nr:pseudaminic acid cytidylyltransferase [Planctomycetota bacterium]
MAKTLAVIPARGGSKRIPRKNIKPFLGVPIIKYSIDAAIGSAAFDEVMTSTDDDEIARLSASYGAKVPFLRSAKSSDDHATTVDVLEEVILRYRDLGRPFDYLCCIYPTAPFVTPDKLKRAMELLRESGADSVVPVVRFSYPIQRALKIESGRAVMFWPEHYSSRSQDLTPAYHDCGQFYCVRVDSMLRQRRLFAEHTVPLEVSELEVQDIDNEEDWKLAELKLGAMTRPT